jgi:excinuclease ABC subunit C
MPDEFTFDSKRFLKNLTAKPGVYRMLAADGEVIYVGKARNLKKRVASYFRRRPGPEKVRAMVRQITAVEITVTGTETEALILEYNLIKQLKPRYNVLLRDDKSYPWIHVSTEHPYPRISVYRGSRKRSGRFFGPYPSAGSARTAVNHLQKLFQLRPCEDSFFANRTRPCLQHQIQRCSGPCVGLIEHASYAEDVQQATRFLHGDDQQIVTDLNQRMDAASETQDFERAAVLRDQIKQLREAQARQITGGGTGDLDVVAVRHEGGQHGVGLMFVRRGDVLGTRSYFPRTADGTEPVEVLSAFLAQHYLGRTAPREILVDREVEDRDLLEETLGQTSGHQVRISVPQRGDRVRWMAMLDENIKQALMMRLASDASVTDRLQALADELGLDAPPRRIECFDVSHSQGQLTVASCVVFTETGMAREQYRRFNIEGISPGDDLAALRQALGRRYLRVAKGEVPAPDLLLIDGGSIQLRQAEAVLQEIGPDGVVLVGIAKGPSRRPGREQLFLSGREAPLRLPADSAALHLLQQVRDEAHRFAITAHRRRRERSGVRSVLEDIPGLGPKRRRALLQHFGGLRAIEGAGIDDLARVTGISAALAQRIYDRFRGEA